jgi:pyruvate/2-oxoglutarate dehydrogenase complex dihydrolipoamide dehydrogenase (E3) component
VIVGGGYIGLEMADALVHRGLEVTLLEQAPAVMTTVDIELGQIIGNELVRRGVTLLTSAFVRRIEWSAGRLVVSGDGFDDAEGDVVLMVVSVRPDTQLASEAGIALGVRSVGPRPQLYAAVELALGPDPDGRTGLGEAGDVGRRGGMTQRRSEPPFASA